MSSQDIVFYTDADDTYHRDRSCPLFQHGQGGSESSGYQVHEVKEDSETVALSAGKKPCTHCGRSILPISLPEPLWDIDHSADLLRRYLKDFTGAWFERLDGGGDAPGVANRFTPADVLAVATLSVNIPATAFIPLLHTEADGLTALLAKIPTDIDLTDATDDMIGPESPAWELWGRLDALKGIEWVGVGKLLARKRPRLIPVYDNYVKQILNRPKEDIWFWHDLRDALRADDRALERHLVKVRDRVGDAGRHLSILRTFDIIVWLHAHDTLK